MIRRRTPAQVVSGVAVDAPSTHEVAPGDRVRSYDFANLPGVLQSHVPVSDSFVEGVVEEIGAFPEVKGGGLMMAKIRAVRRVLGGAETQDFAEYYYAPVNGIPIAGTHGEVTSGIVVLDHSPRPG